MKKFISIVLSICILCSVSAPAFADDVSKTKLCEVSVFVDGNWYGVKALNASYDNNLYLSMRSLAEAFSSCSKKFDFKYDYSSFDGSYFSIVSGGAYEKVESKNVPEDSVYLELKRNRLFVDDRERRYYSYRLPDPEDLYVSVIDICFIFDINATLVDKNAIWFRLDEPFSSDLKSLDEDGYFDSVNSILFANYETGKVYLSKRASTPYAIASITKLMTYLLVVEAAESGRFSLDDTVSLSENVQRMSESENGLIKMEQGQTPTVRELLNAMLVASSNEAAVALAEFTCGSESSFTTQMNRRARQMGLKTSKFYNCDGLPIYSQRVYPVKRQNLMSSSDLFVLVRYILSEHPEITEFTSQQFAYFPTFDYTTANSNPLVFNLDNVTGLKTGNTNLAGCCLVASDSSGNIAIVLGCEDNAIRGRIAEILLRSER